MEITLSTLEAIIRFICINTLSNRLVKAGTRPHPQLQKRETLVCGCLCQMFFSGFKISVHNNLPDCHRRRLLLSIPSSPLNTHRSQCVCVCVYLCVCVCTPHIHVRGVSLSGNTSRQGHTHTHAHTHIYTPTHTGWQQAINEALIDELVKICY